MRHVVDVVVSKLLERVDEDGQIVGGSTNGVLPVTEPDVRVDKIARSYSSNMAC